MSLQPETNPVPSAIDEEHEELHVTLQSLREMVTKSDRDRDALQDLVRELTEQVTRHFEHEEQGGYFEVAVKRAPRLAEQARDLCRQHEDLSERVLSLNALASAGAESNGWWERIESDSLEFIARMFEHESAEKALLQRAYVEDLGAGD